MVNGVFYCCFDACSSAVVRDGCWRLIQVRGAFGGSVCPLVPDNVLVARDPLDRYLLRHRKKFAAELLDVMAECAFFP